MTGILDRVARSRFPAPKQKFVPSIPQHVFALRLAQRMNDGAAAQHYAELCDSHSEGTVLAAYRRSAQSGTKELARTFHATLAQLDRITKTVPERDLAAIRVERRAIAVAIFHGTNLKYPPVARQLSSDANKALGSAAGFISRVWDKCSFSNVALETLPPGCEAQRSQLARIVTEELEQRQVTIWHCDKKAVLAAFGHPAPRFRRNVREVISAMWPEVDGGFGTPVIKDALALGLYCQVEHLLNIEN